MSMEEEAARQAAANAPPPAQPTASDSSDVGAGAAGAAEAGSLNNDASAQPSQPVHAATTDITTTGTGTGASSATATAIATTDATEEALLQQALALSEGRSGPDIEMTEESGGDESMTEEEMIARAIEMSMNPEQPESEESEK